MYIYISIAAFECQKFRGFFGGENGSKIHHFTNKSEDVFDEICFYLNHLVLYFEPIITECDPSPDVFSFTL